MAVKSFNKKGKRRRNILRIILLVLGLALFVWFMVSDLWRISAVQVVGAKHSDSGAIEAQIKDILGQSQLFIFPGNQKYTYSRGKIEEAVLQTFPGVEEIEMRADSDGTLTATIKDRRALGVWCDSEECYFYDDFGVLFKKSFSYTGALFTKWRYVASDARMTLGQKVPCIDVCMNEKFLYFLHDKRIAEAVMEGETMRLQSTDDYYIKAGLDATTTMAHIEQIEKKEVGILKKVEYVDVRFPNKIFYKVRGE